MCRVDRVRNAEIRQRIQKLDTTVNEIEKRRLVWLGHVQRMGEERWPKKILNWTPSGRRKRGRPPETWMNQVWKDMQSKNLEEGDWSDREGWRMGCERRLEL